MSDHVSSGCPDVILECEYNYAGCEFKKSQRDMDVHMEASVGSHLSLVSKSTQNSLSQKDREIEELKAELQQLKMDLRQQKENNNTQIQEVRQQYAELSQEVQRQRARQLRECRQWQKNHHRHWMWIMLLIAVVGVIHSYLYYSSSDTAVAITTRYLLERIYEIEKHLKACEYSYKEQSWLSSLFTQIMNLLMTIKGH